MRRIGKTDDGRVLIEATPAELREIDTAIETLVEFQAACAGFAPEIRASAEVARVLDDLDSMPIEKAAQLVTGDDGPWMANTVRKAVRELGADAVWSAIREVAAARRDGLLRSPTGGPLLNHCLARAREQLAMANNGERAAAEIARVATPRTVKEVVRRIQGQVVGSGATKTCRTCKVEKPLKQFAKFQRSCVTCMKAKHFPAVGAAAKKEAAKPTADRLSKIRDADQRTKLKTGPREPDPELDRPTEGGRVLPVGGEG